MSSQPLPFPRSTTWLHSFPLDPHLSLHNHHDGLRCSCRLHSTRTATGTATSAASSPSRRQNRLLVKRAFQTSLTLLLLCCAALLCLHSPRGSSSVVEETKTLRTKRSVDVSASFASNRLVRTLRSSNEITRPNSFVETNEIPPLQPLQPQQPRRQVDAASSDPQLLRRLKAAAVVRPPPIDEATRLRQVQRQQEELLRRQLERQRRLTEAVGGSTGAAEASTAVAEAAAAADIPQTELKDILFTVKTSAKFHSSRLPILLDTWVSFVREQTIFVSDAEDENLRRRIGDKLLATNCSNSHNRKALCCKMSHELDAFLRDSSKRWFCHVDDDTYVNIPEMLHLLRSYDHREDWYLGKPSLRHPIEIVDRNHLSHSPGDNNNNNNNNRASFWFATGGAGFCVSRSLADKMAPVAGNGRFRRVGDAIRMTDDITMGYVAEHVLGTRLTVVERFHSHLESMRLIPPSQINKQVTLSYGSYGSETNVLRIKGFDERFDPSRLRSLHCKLFQEATGCGNIV